MNPEQQPRAELYREIEALASRDWQLWSICALVLVVIGIGLAAFMLALLDQKKNLTRARSEMLRHLMECAEAKQVAIIDPLTGVFNRRYLDQLIPREISRSMRGGGQLSFS